MPFGSAANSVLTSAKATRRMRRLAASTALAMVLFAYPALTTASAFEIFGYDIGSDGIKPAKSEDTDIVDPVRYEAALESTDDSVSDALEAASLLVGQQDKPVSGTAGLLLKARNDQKRIIAALYRLGRYGGTVDVTINGRDFDQIDIDEDFAANGVAKVAVAVDPGPQFTFSDPQAFLSDGTPISLSDLGIVKGAPARSQLVLDAEDSLITNYKEKGYPFAKVTDRALEADLDTKQLDLSLAIDTGEQARLGNTQVSGAESVDPDFITKHADIEQGVLYSPQEIDAAAKRLRALGVFDSVIVKVADSANADGTVPVLIDVKERKHRTIGVGVTMGNLDGIGLEAFWTHRNLFGQAERLRVEGSATRIGQDRFSDIDYNGAVIFAKPGVLGPASVFEAELAVASINPEAFEKRSVSGAIGLRYRFTEQLSGRIGAKTEYSRLKDANGTKHSLLTSLPMELAYDTRDNKLDPTEGFQILVDAEPTISNRDSIRFLKASATVTAYQALDEAKKFVLAGKVSAGTIVGASVVNVPADRRFFTGGGGSIRGYAYQAAGPRDSDNKPAGGRSYALASVEGRFRVTDSLGFAVFADTGGTFNSTLPGKNGDWYTGVGAGIRYLTPVGPLRLDVAVPLKKIKGEPQYGVYLGLGQAF